MDSLEKKIALAVHDWHCPDEVGIDEVYWTGPRMQDYLECAEAILALLQPAPPAEGELISDDFIKAKIKEFGWIFPEPAESHVKTLDLLCQFKEIAQAQLAHDKQRMMKLPSEDELKDWLEGNSFDKLAVYQARWVAQELLNLLKVSHED